MRKVELSMKEEKQYNVIKKLVDSNGNKKRVAVKLGCTLRHINRLIIKYKKEGKSAFVHGNTGKTPINKIPEEQVIQIQDFYCQHIPDANFRHATELIQEHLKFSISDTTLNTILKANYILSPKAHRLTKKQMKKTLKDLKTRTTLGKELYEIETKIEGLDRHQVFPRRPRCAYYGELIQIDASEYLWFGGVKYHLHLAIDDATGKIVGAYFDRQETLNGYYNVLRQILINHGIPYRFLSDRRTVFEYKLKNAPSDQEDTFTHFAYACHQLGIEISTTSVPQAKGRVERLNGTLQSRLPVELKLREITSVEEANRYLDEFIKAYNERFALPIHHSKNVFEKQPTHDNVNLILAVLSRRVIDGGHCIKYLNKFYLPKTANGLDVFYPKGTPALVIEAFDGELYTNINDTIYHLEEVEQRHKQSKAFDEIKEVKRHKKTIPSMHHPWRIGTVEAFMREQKHRIDRANV